MTSAPRQLTILEPHGFCAGVANALRCAKTLASRRGGQPLYCLHELVHNELVVSDLKAQGFVFVDDIEAVPDGADVLFSAHGVAPRVRRRAAAKRLRVTDATCPFVARVHRAARDFAERGLKVEIIGNPDHAEVQGILGEIEGFEPTCDRLGVVSQTTMNADEVRRIVDGLKRRGEVEAMAEVCNATKERQDAVKAFDGDMLIVLGSANSSNTGRLVEVAKCPAARVGSLEELRRLELDRVCHLGITSGASTPEEFFRAAVAHLRRVWCGQPQENQPCENHS